MKYSHENIIVYFTTCDVKFVLNIDKNILTFIVSKGHWTDIFSGMREETEYLNTVKNEDLLDALQKLENQTTVFEGWKT